MAQQTILPQTGVAFELKKGQLLKVIDPYGQQVSDLFCVDQHNLADGLSSGRTIDYNDTIYLKPGHFLFGNSGAAFLKIIEDTCGRHDLLVTPCSLQMFRMISGDPTCQHPSCLENLTQSLKSFGVQDWQVTSTFNIFMNITVAASGRIQIEPPLSQANDYIVFEACRDLIIALTACSDEGTNNGICKPIIFETLMV